MKVRQSDELFERDQPASQRGGMPATPTLAFDEYLRTTEAAPLSTTIKALLWSAAVVVALLFAGALWKMNQPKRVPKPAETAKPAGFQQRPDPYPIRV